MSCNTCQVKFSFFTKDVSVNFAVQLQQADLPKVKRIAKRNLLYLFIYLFCYLAQIGCPSCGYSCCSKCLKYKCDVPDVGRRKVCGRCHNNLSKMRKSNPDVSADDAFASDVDKQPLAPIDITMK